MRAFAFLVLPLALAACGDPLRDIERLSDIELADTQSISALPSEEELARETGVLTDLLASRPDPVETPRDAAPERRGSLLGWLTRGAAVADNPAVEDLPAGAAPAFGQVSSACHMRGQPLGQKVETSNTRGQTYKIYDSAPGSTAPRPFYITGFADNCPRQITAALALFGDVAMHEQLRYGQPSEQYPYSETDQAYETIKSRICRVGAGKPCGKRLETLARDTVFISVYERFTDNGRWADILLHDGEVMAAALKTP